MDECQTTFEDLKQYLESPLLLSKPEEGEQLSLYFAISPDAISLVLIREDIETQKIRRKIEPYVQPLESI